MKQEYAILNVSEVGFDTDNPRIKMALKKYGDDNITAERISFALRSSDSGTTTASFSQLKDSIHANHGIIQPITVVYKNERCVCIDGNTRLAIYKDFSKEDIGDDWNKIQVLILHDAKQRDIEAIRMSAHLVGAREWPAYEKARYLHYLYHKEFLEYSEMVALCGGNQREIQRQIDAFNDMNECYPDITTADTDRFSGFVELQKTNIKDSIFEAGYVLQNFGDWIKNGNIRRLANVRQLPRVLQDAEATSVFVDGEIGSIEEAIKLVERKTEDSMKVNKTKVNIENASLQLLAQELSQKINNMPFTDLQFLQSYEKNAVEQVGVLEGLVDSINQLLSNVRK